MTQEEAKKIFNETICGHWENWPRSAEELYVWVKALTPYDYKVARDAINALYAEWDGKQYPKMPMLMAVIKKAAAQRQQGSPLIKRYLVENEEGKPVWRPFFAKASVAHEELEREAEKLCQEAGRMFPKHKHHAKWFSVEIEQDMGCYGPDARDMAFLAIADGPDCPAKRWLSTYLDHKARKVEAVGLRAKAVDAKKQQEPIAIGVVVDDIPF